jgi:purine-binding chemotaxis protein CheW
MNATGVVTFWVGGAEFGLEVAPIQEVLRVGPIARVPRASRRARGLTRVRGRLVPIVDTAVALGFPAATISAESRIVLVSRGPRLVGLLVDRIAGLRRDEPGDGAEAAPMPVLLELDRLLEGA